MPTEDVSDEKMVQALRELTDACEAEYCSADTDGEGDDSKVAFPEESCSITFGMIRRARAALNAHESRAQPASVPDGWVMVPKMFVDFVRDAPVSSGVCGCGTSMDNHSSHLSCGHSPIDQWESALASWMQKIDNAPQAVRAQPASVADWVLVPREPTVEMLRAEDEALPSREDEDTNPWAWGRASWAAFLAAAPQPPKEGVADGLSLIASERKRQVSEEGWTPEHDDEHTDGELSDAAACYALGTRIARWPWSTDWWKPTPDNRIHELTKAGALIVAEIDRLQRAAAPQPPKEPRE